MSVFGVILVRIFIPEFGQTTERYGVPLRIQSKCGKIRTRIILNTDTFHELQGSKKLFWLFFLKISYYRHSQGNNTVRHFKNYSNWWHANQSYSNNSDIFSIFVFEANFNNVIETSTFLEQLKYANVKPFFEKIL